MGILRSGGDGGSQPPGGPVYPGTPMHPAGAPPPGPSPGRWNQRAARWLVLAAALFGVVTLCCAGSLAIVAISLPGGYTRPDAAPPSDPGRAPEPSAVPGTPVRDGHLTFIIDRVDCGVRSVGRPPKVRTTEGQFCLVHLSVTNADERPVGFRDTDQRAFGPDGAEYGADPAAGALVAPGSAPGATRLDPGHQAAEVLVFDIPAGTHLSRLRLHESPQSAGVEVVVR